MVACYTYDLNTGQYFNNWYLKFGKISYLLKFHSKLEQHGMGEKGGRKRGKNNFACLNTDAKHQYLEEEERLWSDVALG